MKIAMTTKLFQKYSDSLKKLFFESVKVMDLRERLKLAYENVEFAADSTWSHDFVYQQANMNILLLAKSMQALKNARLRARTVRDCIPNSKLTKYGNYEYNEARELSYTPDMGPSTSTTYDFSAETEKEPWMLDEVDKLFKLYTESDQHVDETKEQNMHDDIKTFESPLMKCNSWDEQMLKSKIKDDTIKILWTNEQLELNEFRSAESCREGGVSPDICVNDKSKDDKHYTTDHLNNENKKPLYSKVLGASAPNKFSPGVGNQITTLNINFSLSSESVIKKMGSGNNKQLHSDSKKSRSTRKRRSMRRRKNSSITENAEEETENTNNIGKIKVNLKKKNSPQVEKERTMKKNIASPRKSAVEKMRNTNNKDKRRLHFDRCEKDQFNELNKNSLQVQKGKNILKKNIISPSKSAEEKVENTNNKEQKRVHFENIEKNQVPVITPESMLNINFGSVHTTSGNLKYINNKDKQIIHFDEIEEEQSVTNSLKDMLIIDSRCRPNMSGFGIEMDSNTVFEDENISQVNTASYNPYINYPPNNYHSSFECENIPQINVDPYNPYLNYSPTNYYSNLECENIPQINVVSYNPNLNYPSSNYHSSPELENKSQTNVAPFNQYLNYPSTNYHSNLECEDNSQISAPKYNTCLNYPPSNYPHPSMHKLAHSFQQNFSPYYNPNNSHQNMIQHAKQSLPQHASQPHVDNCIFKSHERFSAHIPERKRRKPFLLRRNIDENELFFEMYCSSCSTNASSSDDSQENIYKDLEELATQMANAVLEDPDEDNVK